MREHQDLMTADYGRSVPTGRARTTFVLMLKACVERLWGWAKRSGHALLPLVRLLIQA